jgi:hypothetical protein
MPYPFLPLALAVSQMRDICLLPVVGGLIVSLIFWLPVRFFRSPTNGLLWSFLRCLTALPSALVGLVLVSISIVNLWADGVGSLGRNFPELMVTLLFGSTSLVIARWLWKSLGYRASYSARFCSRKVETKSVSPPEMGAA